MEGQETQASMRAGATGLRVVILNDVCDDDGGGDGGVGGYECFEMKCPVNSYGHESILCVQNAIRRWYVSKKRTDLKNEYMVLVNGDIYLPQTLGTSISTILDGVRELNGDDRGILLVGNRTNYLCEEGAYFPAELMGSQGKYGLDYFVLPAKSFLNKPLPPFLLGVYRWDNYLLNTHIIEGELHVLDVRRRAKSGEEVWRGSLARNEATRIIATPRRFAPRGPPLRTVCVETKRAIILFK